MRLLDTTTLSLSYFPSSDVPPYVILSHTWEDGEVTFQDIQGPRDLAEKKKGFGKLSGCCDKAREDGYKYAWIDTCCIDKTSSAELTEAINSMYRWYMNADICYAYLVDIPSRWMVISPWQNHFDRKGLFRRSRWFTRGWTLQELIAPPTVEFYAADWGEIGTKRSLKTQLAAVTGIDMRVLEGASPAICNAAERMSWVADRRTTRLEDSAYCLLGIFNVNIPLIYGEGKKALHRLQQEILNTTNDDTVLAWGLSDEDTKMFEAGQPSQALSAPEVFKTIKDQIITRLAGGVKLDPLAQDISDFRALSRSRWKYSDLRRLQQRFDTNTVPPTLTRRGLQAVLWVRDCGDGIFLACVNHSIDTSLLCLCLSRPDESLNIFSRLGGIGCDSWFALVPIDLIKHFQQRTIIISRPDGRNTSSQAGRPARQLGRELQTSISEGKDHFVFRMRTSSEHVVYSRTHLGRSLAEDGLEFLEFVHVRWGSKEPAVVIVGNSWGKILPVSDPLFSTPSGPMYINKSPSFRSSLADQVCLAVASRYPAPREVTDRLVTYFDSYAISVSWRVLRHAGGAKKVVIELNSWDATSEFRFSASSLLSSETPLSRR